jgi:diaminopimelate decarboxylase
MMAPSRIPKRYRTVTLPSTLLPDTAGRDAAGCLTIAGHSLRPLAEQYGTPLYLYDAATVASQYNRLRAALSEYYPGSYEITYAAKAYFSLGMARRLTGMGLGVDVVSMGELTVARRAGFAPNRVHLHGNNKSVAELEAALDWGVESIVVDSLEELEILEQVAAQAQKQARIWLRISPGIVVDSHSFLQTAHHTSKFGFTTEGGQAAKAIRRAQESRWLKLSGLHTHLGSQFFEAAPYREAIISLMSLAETSGLVLEDLSPGGGWGVPYVPGQPDGDPLPWIETVTSTVKDECARRGWPLPRLVVEPGRWLVARAALALYTVGTTKTSGDGTHFVAVDGGMADNPRPALYDARYTAILAERPDAEAINTVNLVGKFCESGDQLIPEVCLPDVRRGDLLVVPVAGAYQLSMASNYNLAPRPAVLWFDEERIEVLQQREQPEERGWWVEA